MVQFCRNHRVVGVDQALIIEANGTVIVLDFHTVEAQIAVTAGDLYRRYGNFQRFLDNRKQLVVIPQGLIALCQFEIGICVHGVVADRIVDDACSFFCTVQFQQVVTVEQDHLRQVKDRTHQLLGRAVEVQIQLMFQRVAEAKIYFRFGFPIVHANLGVQCFCQLERFFDFLFLNQLVGFGKDNVQPLAVDVHHFVQDFPLVVRQDLICQISDRTSDFFCIFCGTVLVRL